MKIVLAVVILAFGFVSYQKEVSGIRYTRSAEQIWTGKGDAESGSFYERCANKQEKMIVGLSGHPAIETECKDFKEKKAGELRQSKVGLTALIMAVQRIAGLSNH